MTTYSLKFIAQTIGAETCHCKDRDVQIDGVGTLEDGQAGQIGFLAESQYAKFLPMTQLSAVIVNSYHEDAKCCQLVVKNVKSAWRKVVELFALTPDFTGIDTNAFVADTAQLPDRITVESGVNIGENCVIGQDCVIRSGVSIGRNVSIGQGCYISQGVNILDNTVIGDNAYINSGAVIGSRGFGFSFENNTWQPIAQLGRVVIGNDVEIGANTTIDRGAVNDTIIGDGVKLDNLIQVGHNVVIGEHTIIAGCCVIAGSTTIGRYCMIGGASVLAGHINICDHVQITGHTSLSKSIQQAGVYSSAFPAMPNKRWNRLVAIIRRLDKQR